MQVNPGHAPASVEAVPAKWQQKTLIELAGGRKELFDDGDWIESEHITTTGIRLIQTGNIGIGTYVEKEAKKYIYEASFAALRCKPLKQGDLLICRLADPAGRACVLPDIGEPRVVTSVDVTIFRPPPEMADRVFLCNVFSTPNWFRAVSDRSGGTTHKRISRGALGRIAIALPPIEEQRAIAAALNDVDALLAGLDRLIAKKRDLKQAAMQQLLTGQTRLPGFEGEWQRLPLGSVVADLEAGVSVNSVTGGSYHSLGEPGILKTSCVANGVFDPEEFKLIDQREISRARLSPRQNTLIISRMNTPNLVGEVGFVEQDHPNLFLPDRLWITRFRPDSGLWPKWLAYQMSSPITQVAIKDLASGTSGSMKNISKSKLLALPLDFPPPAEQAAIAAFLSDMDAELTALEARRHKTRALKQGMMQELLTGRTRLV